MPPLKNDARLLRSSMMIVRAVSVAIFCLLFILSLCSGSLYAAEPILTTVTGSITDGSARAIENATITFANNLNKVEIKSANTGAFIVTLPAGTYRLTVRAKGYDDATRGVVTIGDLPLNVQVTMYAVGGLKTIASVSVKTIGDINATPAAINSISSQQITAQGSIGLSRVLSEIPGVQITMSVNQGNGGSFAYEYAADSPANPIYIGIRGSQPYENATLYDGHRVNSANWLSPIGYAGGQSGSFNVA